MEYIYDGVTVKRLERTGGCSCTSLFSKMTRLFFSFSQVRGESKL